MRTGIGGDIVGCVARTVDGQAPGAGRRVVVELAAEEGTVSGRITTSDGDRPFWGWLELMSALERAAEGGVVPAEETRRNS
jgi:hypothetical protein